MNEVKTILSSIKQTVFEWSNNKTNEQRNHRRCPTNNQWTSNQTNQTTQQAKWSVQCNMNLQSDEPICNDKMTIETVLNHDTTIKEIKKRTDWSSQVSNVRPNVLNKQSASVDETLSGFAHRLSLSYCICLYCVFHAFYFLGWCWNKNCRSCALQHLQLVKVDFLFLESLDCFLFYELLS